MRSQIQESADAQSDLSACMRETHEGPSQSCRGYLLTPIAAVTHLRRLRLGDLSVLGARMGLWPSEREGLSKILAPNTLRHFSIQEKSGIDPPNLTSARLPNSLSPKHRGPTLASASGGRSLQCGSRRRYRHPEPNRLCDLACAVGESLSAHSEASTDMVPQRRPASGPPQPASERASASERGMRSGGGGGRRRRISEVGERGVDGCRRRRAPGSCWC